MTKAQSSDDTAGCIGCVAIVLVIAIVVAALISIAALVDPFSWMPAVDEVWAECDDDLGTDRDECALENRFPGFWLHAVANLVYGAAALASSLVFAGSVVELRQKRVGRFSSASAAAEHRAAQQSCLGSGAVLGALAAVPIVVAAV